MAGAGTNIPSPRRHDSAAANASMERQMDAIRQQSQASSKRVPSTTMQNSNTVLPFFLPRVVREHYDECCQARNNDAYLDHDNENHDFSLHNLAWAIQNGVDEKCIERYLTQQNEAVIAGMLSQPIPTTWGTRFFPILYFAAERNSPQIVRILCQAGADPSQRITKNGATATDLPLLPYSILSAENQLSDTTDTVIALLAMGADPHDVPQDMWQDYLKPPTKDAPEPQPAASSTHQTWCTVKIRSVLCRSFTLLQRYSVWKAAQIARPSVRDIQVAKAHKIMPLFETPYHIFGQQIATTQVLERITSRLLYNSQTPLVLLFTGLSGHGKTELARRMGSLLSLDLIVIDCTMLSGDTDIFGPWAPYLGPWAPYQGWQHGSRLNNHLAENDGMLTVVFLDEFDKTTEDVRKAMLLLFESGSYTDRRNNTTIDCSKVIWVLAANLGVREISMFWTANLKNRSPEQQKEAPIRDLQSTLRKCIIQAFGAPLTGRLSAIVPFFPFDEGERAITAYKFMRELWHEVRKPISTDAKRFAGSLFVDFVNDGQIAMHIAGRYTEETGARSLALAVEEEIGDCLAGVFLGEEGVVRDDMNGLPLVVYKVRVARGAEGKDGYVEVARAGTKAIQNGTA
ncbi:P-loop containing nucleoside triphosphate hydrolase protein [Usnea florida]